MRSAVPAARYSWVSGARHLFNIYLLLGSLSIVVATTVFTIRITKSVERQSFLTTQLLLGRGQPPAAGGQAARRSSRSSTSSTRSRCPFIITDNAGRPVLWNEPVIGIPLPDYQVLLQENIVQRPANPVILEILSLAASFDQEQEPFAIFDPDGQRVGTLHYGRSALSQRICGSCPTSN